jgi:hypothetical protein
MTMKLKALGALALIATLAACAGAPPAAGQPGATGPGKKEAPMMVGPDIIADVPLADAWALVSNVDKWSDWNSRISGVTHTAAVAEGAVISYVDGGKKIEASVTEFKDQSLLVWEGSATGSRVRLRWMLKAMDPARTLVSLRAELKPSAAQELMGQAGAETSQWISAVQVALAKQAQAIKAAAPAPKKKKAPKAAK